jgi:hypothetical protein
MKRKREDGENEDRQGKKRKREYNLPDVLGIELSAAGTEVKYLKSLFYKSELFVVLWSPERQSLLFSVRFRKEKSRPWVTSPTKTFEVSLSVDDGERLQPRVVHFFPSSRTVVYCASATILNSNEKKKKRKVTRIRFLKVFYTNDHLTSKCVGLLELETPRIDNLFYYNDLLFVCANHRLSVFKDCHKPRAFNRDRGVVNPPKHKCEFKRVETVVPFLTERLGFFTSMFNGAIRENPVRVLTLVNEEYLFIGGVGKFMFYNFTEGKFSGAYNFPLFSKRVGKKINSKSEESVVYFLGRGRATTKTMYLSAGRTVVDFTMRLGVRKRILQHKSVVARRGVFLNDWLIFVGGNDGGGGVVGRSKRKRKKRKKKKKNPKGTTCIFNCLSMELAYSRVLCKGKVVHDLFILSGSPVLVFG